MDFEKSKKFLIKIGIIYWVLVVVTYFAAGDQFNHSTVKSDSLSANTTFGEIIDGDVITQRIISPADQLQSLEFYGTRYNRDNSCTINFELKDSNGNTIVNQPLACADVQEGKYTTVTFDEKVNCGVNEELTLVITSTGASNGDSIGIFYGNSFTTGRFDIEKQVSDEELYRVNGQAGLGQLCITVTGDKFLNFYKTYWLYTTGAFLLVTLYAYYGMEKAKKGKNSYVIALCTLYTKYSFLLKQLVSREFTVKYKRSVLGVAWSFINPLLTMAVQYVVFSTLFKSDTPNYPVYLLSGIVFFNFFNEAVGSGMTSITGNATLIKKVYMPKYIYPLSKLFSSLINFLISLIPLMIVMIVTGTPIKWSMLLLIFDIMCLLGFILGMILLLSTLMTFFQDTQFLWTVISLLWMYMTPIFYTPNIIPNNLLVFYHMNPMYQYITFARTCIIDGVSPQPTAYLWCIVSSVIVLLIGMFTFKRHQDKFVLYL